MAFEFLLNKKKKKRKFWFEDNQDAQGYRYGDNRVIQSPIPLENRREQVRRTWNF